MSNQTRAASICILNWNGRDLLQECLPSVVRAVQHAGGEHEILVIDNGSNDGSVEFLQSTFPQVRVVPLDQNYSYIGGYNRGIKEARGDILVLLNNDMFVDIDFLAPLLEGFSDDQVFAVSSQIFFADPEKRREETGKTRAVWSKGLVGYSHDLPDEIDKRLSYIPVFWLGGGSAAIDRRKFLEIGGFDPLLSPLYMEDVDLSYQAWKRGWKILFCPESKVIHKHRASSGRMDPVFLNRIIFRNRLLFIWKNITNRKMFLEHLFALFTLPRRKTWGIGFRETIPVLRMALMRLPQAWQSRVRSSKSAVLGDEEIFIIANDAFSYKQRFVQPRMVSPEDKLRILFVTPYFPSQLHGGGVRMLELIRALSERHEISLLAFYDHENDPDYFEEVEELCQQVVRIERHPVQTHQVIPTYPPAITLDFGDLKFGQALRQMLAEGDYDIVQCEFLQTAYQIPNLWREAMVLTDHEVQTAAEMTRFEQEPSRIRRFHHIFRWGRWLYAEISLARHFDRVVALTGEDARNIQRYDPNLRVEVVETGIDTSYFKPSGEQPEENHLIFVGNFRHPPNVDSAVYLVREILPLVQEQIPNIKLTIVGADPTPEVAALAKAGVVEVTGWVDDLRPYFNRSSLAVFPIRLGVGLRNKILEACAMGKAVVTTPLGSAGLDPCHGENLWIAESARDIAEGIVTLLNNQPLRDKIGLNARIFVENQRSWDRAARLQEQVYRRALEDRDARLAKHLQKRDAYKPGIPLTTDRVFGRKLSYPTTALGYLIVAVKIIPLLWNSLRTSVRSRIQPGS